MPTFATMPAASWPGATSGSVTRPNIGSPPLRGGTVVHVEVATTQARGLKPTRTSPGPGSGTSTALTSSCRPRKEHGPHRLQPFVFSRKPLSTSHR